MMKKTKIEWCDATINTVVGCKRNCPYCYAKKMNQRFKWVEKWDEQQFFPERLEALKSKKPKAIFMNSMSDFCYWDEEWKVKIFEMIHENKQHSYIFLTKSENGIKRPYWIRQTHGANVYFGKTHTQGTYFAGFNDNYYNFLSIEPILAPVFINMFGGVRQIIIGAETGNRKGKVIPQKEWIDNIVKQANKHGIRVFMKDSLKKIMGNDFRQDPLIWGIE